MNLSISISTVCRFESCVKTCQKTPTNVFDLCTQVPQKEPHGESEVMLSM